MNRPKLVLCDFDGVLSRFDEPSKKEGFYAPLLLENPTLHKEILGLLFSSGNHLGKSWMSGQITYTDVNALMAHKFGVDKEYLDTALLKSLQHFTLNRPLLGILQDLRRLGTTVVLMSDNMDVFTQYVVPQLELNVFFDAIYSSAAVQKMKSDNHWELPKTIARNYGCDYAEVLVIDDWELLTTSLATLGFTTFLYQQETRSAFEIYATKWL